MKDFWKVRSKFTDFEFKKSFPSFEEADRWRKRLGFVLSENYKTVIETADNKKKKLINEGLVKGDLRDILLPRLSVDEYVPADSNTDNIVLAFFIKGVPEAVIPFKNFCEKSNGVLLVDYGDSDSVVNSSVVYVEFDRENLDIRDIAQLISQISMLSSFEPEDLTMTFPHTNDKFPFDLNLLKQYFKNRNERENKLAQLKAEKKAEKERIKQIKQARRQREQEQEQEQEQDQKDRESEQETEARTESRLVEAIVNLF